MLLQCTTTTGSNITRVLLLPLLCSCLYCKGYSFASTIRPNNETKHLETTHTPRSGSILRSTKENSVPTLILGFAVSTVGDRVDYSPNLAGGGFVDPVRKRRFTSHQLSADWISTRNLTLRGSIAFRNFTSLRDQFNFSTYRINASYLLPAMSKDSTTSLDISIGTNRAEHLHKNSFTQVGDNLIKQVTVKSPSDFYWRASLTQEKSLTDRIRFGYFSGVGQTISSHRGLVGTGVDSSGCKYDFQLSTDSGVVDQQDICGNIYSMRRTYPDESSIYNDLQVSPRSDLQNNAWFYRVGGTLTSSFKYWQTKLEFYHQRYIRKELDRRIRNQGGEVYDANNVFSFQAIHFVTKNLSYGATLEYHKHQFLDELPVLYTRLTSDRFAGDVVHLTLQLNYMLGK